MDSAGGEARKRLMEVSPVSASLLVGFGVLFRSGRRLLDRRGKGNSSDETGEGYVGGGLWEEVGYC